MIVEFSVGNYRSFKDIVTLSMVAADISSKPKELDESNTFAVGDDLRLLKSAVVYGANAHGKSNLVAALRFMRHFVLISSRDTQVAELISVEPFELSIETDGQPSHFEIVFLLDGMLHRYGFELTAERVTAEWLYNTPSTKEARLFKREGDTIIVNRRSFCEGLGLERRTRANALFLSVVAQFGGSVAETVLRWFKRMSVSVGLSDSAEMLRAMVRFDTSSSADNIVRFVQQLDLGIDGMHVERFAIAASQPPTEAPEHIKRVFELLTSGGDEQLAVKTRHCKYDAAGVSVGNVVFDLDTHESQGTRKLFALAYPVLRALRNGEILVIDELDARLHSALTIGIVRLFNSTETNHHNAQLIFTTHDTNLLGSQLFRRDQIWFVEKSQRGASDLYSLVEYRIDNQVVRNDASFEKDYIAGRYGAIPFIGNLEQVLGTLDTPEAIAK